MKVILAPEERDQIIEKLVSEDQRYFIDEQVKNGKRTAFARLLARSKGVYITDSMNDAEVERFIDDWTLVDYIDAGPNYLTQGYKCQCGRTLRYMYIVQHIKTGESVPFGKEHFAEHTKIPPAAVKTILEGMDAIDYEKDEILLKLRDGWQFSRLFPSLPERFALPEGLQEQLCLGLPLLDSQLVKLRHLLQQYVLPERAQQTSLPPSSVVTETRDMLEPIQFTIDDLFEFPHRTEEMEARMMGHIYEGIESARAICELLIQGNQTWSKRFSTGKPCIYPEVCTRLDEKANSGELVLVNGIQGGEDRIYRLPK